MMKRLFSSNKHSKAHSDHAAGRPGRPSSPPPNIYAGYVDNNAGALGSNFFSSTAALPNQYQPPPVNGANGANGANGHHPPPGAYLNSNGVTAGNGGSPGHHYGSSASSISGNHSYTTGSYLNSVPASSVNGDDASIYGGSTLGRNSSVSDAGYNNIPLPPSAPVNAHAGAGAGAASAAKYNPGFNGSSGPFPPRQPPPPANMQPTQHQHQALPTRTRKPVHPASSGLQAVHEQRVAVPQQQQQQQQQRAVHTRVTAEDIRETTYMLRQLYKMELQIYGERYAIHRDDKTRREEMRRKVDLLREEIEDIVHTWSITDSAGWTSEELQHVQYSLNIISNLRTMGQEAET
ncbi:hypothetical protein F503_00764 [Ophiostoma piceae UAMH 11346]|uniref:Uncharacterized protein n=1 Tax=Ophiostoma piceae (strain UAMH 11346) TaxID=1262450 RepID=S3C7Q3_OPHP1|nr:hypothetical protein F503_00764 [Ophiostoma piceae UAMH 11346]